jgi:hypothetical protein
MRSILKVLAETKEPMKLTQIILKVKNLKPYRTHLVQDPKTLEIIEIEKPWPPFIQLELASAIAGKSLTWYMGPPGSQEEKAQREAAKLYVSFGRSMNKLVEHGLVSAWVDWIHYNHYVDSPRQRQYAYFLTDEGKKKMVRIN